MATLVLPDDPEALVLIVTAMADEMVDYLANDGLYRQLVVQAPGHTYHPTMTAGLVLDVRARLRRLSRVLSASQAAQAREAESRIDDALASYNEPYGAKLRHELDALIGSWRWYIDGCEHGDDDCADTYVQEVWHRTRLADLLAESNGHGIDVATQRTAIADLDGRLKALLTPASYLGPPEERAERDSTSYWWLYGRPSG